MIEKHQIKNAIFIFALIDFLVLPRLAIPFYVPISLYFVVALYFMQNKNAHELNLYLLLVLGVLSSLLFSLIETKSPFNENVKRAMQLISFFVYYFAFLRCRINSYMVLSTLRIFAVYMVLAAIAYGLHPQSTAEFFWRFYPESLGSEEEALYYLRFQYIFQDPNSHGYFSAIVLGMILILEKANFNRIFFFAIFLPVIMITQSRGGLLAYGVLILIFIFTLNLSMVKKILYSAILLLLVGSFLVYLESEFQLIELIINRSNYEEDLGGGRMGKYLYFMSNMNLLPFGVGHYLEIDGEEFRPHSDIIRLFQSYGIVVAGVFAYLIWPRRLGELYIFAPIVICMLINTAINDYRIFGLYLLCLAFLRNIVQKSADGAVGGDRPCLAKC